MSRGEEVGSHLGRGLTLLWEQGRVAAVRRWLGEGENWLDTTVRWVMAGAPVALAAWWLVAAWWRAAIAAAAVCLLALRAATKAAKEQPAAPAKTPPVASVAPADQPAAEDFAALVWDALDGTNAIHINTLAAYLTTATGQTWTADHVRAACQTHDIPTRPKVRDLGGDRVSRGVHREDLPPLSRPLPEEAQEELGGVYVAGQGGNATQLQAAYATPPTRTVRRVGDLRITAVDDPENPARTHVAVADPTRKKARR